MIDAYGGNDAVSQEFGKKGGMVYFIYISTCGGKFISVARSGSAVGRDFRTKYGVREMKFLLTSRHLISFLASLFQNRNLPHFNVNHVLYHGVRY